jgi:hypothetical protein
MISGFHHKVDEICALLGYNAAYSGNIPGKCGSLKLFVSHKKSLIFVARLAASSIGFLCTLQSGYNKL